MTVHKAQGSEFDCVALFLPDRDIPINTREILYTALTRSRSSVVIVGSRDIFESGITRAISRDSGIAEKLRNAPSPMTLDQSITHPAAVPPSIGLGRAGKRCRTPPNHARRQRPPRLLPRPRPIARWAAACRSRSARCSRPR